MRLRKSLTTLGAAAVLAGTIGLLPGAMSAHAASSAGSVAAAAVKPVAGAIRVTGTLANGTAFTGQLSTLSTSVVNNVLTLTGTITGTGLPAAGTTFTNVPIQDLAATPSCKILTSTSGRCTSTCSAWSSTWPRSTSRSPRSPAPGTCSVTCSAPSPACSTAARRCR